MAPEQIEGRECDARSDIFSLGTVLYLLATGELPFQGRNAHQVLKQIAEGQFRDPLQVKPQIGGRLRSVIVRCLQVNPADRFPNARALETELMAFVAAAGIDDPSEFIAQYLKGTRAFSLAFRGRIVEAEVAMGERAMKDGDVPRAMDAFNRVLSLDEQNERVLHAVRRLGRRSRMKRVGFLSGVAALVLGLLGYFASVLTATKHPDQTHTTRAVPTPATPLATQAEQPALEQPAQPKSKTYQALRPSQPLAASATRARPKSGPRKPDDPPAPEGTGPRRVVLRPEPANVAISVDGALPRDFGPSFHELDLAPGPHVFKFIGAHECCVDEQVTLEIPPGPGTTVMAHRLRYRPAGLYVVSNIPANVVVDDGTRGRSRSVIQVAQPEDMFATHVVRVSAEGHQEVVREVRLRAGQVETIEVSLQKTAEPLPPG
jgi:eukaryotic-like serine/threonine-protein kinase